MQTYHAALSAQIEALLMPVAKPLNINYENKPHVILLSGVNGSGKTTTLGKIAYFYAQKGLKVVIGAADTYRAAAREQLEVWAERRCFT